MSKDDDRDVADDQPADENALQTEQVRNPQETEDDSCPWTDDVTEDDSENIPVEDDEDDEDNQEPSVLLVESNT